MDIFKELLESLALAMKPKPELKDIRRTEILMWRAKRCYYNKNKEFVAPGWSPTEFFAPKYLRDVTQTWKWVSEIRDLHKGDPRHAIVCAMKDIATYFEKDELHHAMEYFISSHLILNVAGYYYHGDTWKLTQNIILKPRAPKTPAKPKVEEKPVTNPRVLTQKKPKTKSKPKSATSEPVKKPRLKVKAGSEKQPG